MSKEVPPPTFGGPSPIPPPLPPRKSKPKTEEPVNDSVPLFRLRGQQDQSAPRAAYDDVSENDSDDEIDEEVSAWKRLAIKARRHTRKAAAFAAKQAQLARTELWSFGHQSVLTKTHLKQRFHSGASLAELLREGFPFAKLHEVLGFETVDDIVELGIMQGETRLDPAFWSLFISDFGMCSDDLLKFDLHNLEEYAHAGLTSEHLFDLGVTLQDLAEDGRFTKQCIAGAKAYGWTILDYQRLGLDYGLFKRLNFQQDDYATLFDAASWWIAESLGLYDRYTPIITQHNKEMLEAINLVIV